MSWPIPKIPELPKVSKPKYKFWLYVFIVICCSSYVLIDQFGTRFGYTNLLMFFSLPVLLVWVVCFGMVVHRYEYYLLSYKAWQRESEHTTNLWKEWSKWQQAIIGNVVLSPEEKGASVILGDAKEIPMFPSKGRNLFGEKKELYDYLLSVHLKLESQCLDYRNHLYQIYLMCSDKLNLKDVVDDVFNVWCLMPEILNLDDASLFIKDKASYKGGVLLLCVNSWPYYSAQEHSEFITAQFVSSIDYAHKNNLPVIATLGRAMPLENEDLNEDLNMLFEYMDLNNSELEHVWIVGESKETLKNLMVYASENEWHFNVESSIHLINLSFGPSFKFLFFNSLALVTDAVVQTKKNNLLISQSDVTANLLCLIKPGNYDE